VELIEELKRRETYLATGEVMELLHVTRNTLCAWVRRGDFATVIWPQLAD
jgi:hypothetical protein